MSTPRKHALHQVLVALVAAGTSMRALQRAESRATSPFMAPETVQQLHRDASIAEARFDRLLATAETALHEAPPPVRGRGDVA